MLYKGSEQDESEDSDFMPNETEDSGWPDVSGIAPKADYPIAFQHNPCQPHLPGASPPGPSQSDPSKPGPSSTDPSQTDTSQSNPPSPDHSQSYPSQPGPSSTDPSQTDTSQSNPPSPDHSESSQSMSGDELPPNSQQKRQRRKQRTPQEWKRQVKKTKRLKGEIYKSVRGHEREARAIGPPCQSKYCEKSSLRSCQALSEEHRKEIFAMFWAMNSWEERQTYVRALVDRVIY